VTVRITVGRASPPDDAASTIALLLSEEGLSVHGTSIGRRQLRLIRTHDRMGIL